MFGKVFLEEGKVEVLSSKHQSGVFPVSNRKEVDEPVNVVIVCQGDRLLQTREPVGYEFGGFFRRDIFKFLRQGEEDRVRQGVSGQQVGLHLIGNRINGCEHLGLKPNDCKEYDARKNPSFHPSKIVMEQLLINFKRAGELQELGFAEITC